VAAGRRIMDRYSAAGGGLLAGGLAYAALFAIVPAILLLTGVVGLVIADAAVQAQVVETVTAALPPLSDLIETLVAEVARNAASFSVIGAIALLWGTSRFVVGFETALGRVMGGTGVRSVVIRNVGAFAAVLLILGAVIGATLLSSRLADVVATQPPVLPLLREALGLIVTLLPVGVTIAGMTLIYRIVPLPHPPWRAVVLPGTLSGLALVALASVFAFLAPRLIGSAALLGALATIFAALAWLSLSFQAILIGAAWVSERSQQLAGRAAGVVAPPDE
jgi:membrane protein